MTLYLVVKTLHIISAAILFGTGAGIAFYHLAAHRADPLARRFVARLTVRADFLFTLPAVVAQPVTGAWLIREAGFDPVDYWLVCSYALYLLAGACWIPQPLPLVRQDRTVRAAER